ncbi:glycosyl transferase family 2 domain protein [Nocardiopsis alba ATCC BAA-2165]|uniref:Glycosyl transferase family 2 domain protein n=1 Tax=Nocardiopsis alba (strain ATCC BAA-2165 / BE74) TaxID=1205910 RepID=J7L0X0_NOCAA|nr:glycosyl transferase family 2 domain protein [Nocardiopsis alba ATCC BAA-2165]
MGLTVLRERDKESLKAWFGGFREGWPYRLADDPGRPAADHLSIAPSSPRRSFWAPSPSSCCSGRCCSSPSSWGSWSSP